MGRNCSYLMPKHAGGTPQILVDKTLRMMSRLRVYNNANAPKNVILSDKHCTSRSPLDSCLSLPSPADHGVGGAGVGLVEAAAAEYECPPLLAEFRAEARVYDDVDRRVDH